MRKFEFLRVPMSNDPNWNMEIFHDLNGWAFPSRCSERVVIIQVLVRFGILEKEEDAEFITDCDLDKILLENNIAVTFIDSTED